VAQEAADAADAKHDVAVDRFKATGSAGSAKRSAKARHAEALRCRCARRRAAQATIA